MGSSRRGDHARATDIWNQLVSQLYDSAIEPDNWRVFLDYMSKACGGEPMGLLFYDRLSLKPCENPRLSVYFEPEWIAELDFFSYKENPFIEYSIPLNEGAVVCSSSLIKDDVLTETVFYQNWLKPTGYRYSLIAHILKQEHLLVTLTGLRKEKVTKQELELTRQLLPHLRRACVLHLKMAEHRNWQNAGFSILDGLAMGILLLDARGRVCFTNKTAQLILNQQDGLILKEGNYCETNVLQETDKLNKMVSEAIGNKPGYTAYPGQAMHLSRYSSKRPLYLLVSSLGEDKDTLIDGLSAALFVSDPDHEDLETEINVLRQLYSLTIAQAQLAQALCKGLSAEEYAQHHQLSLNTVRSHLKQIFNKTQTHRQGDLVRLLVSGPAFLAHR